VEAVEGRVGQGEAALGVDEPASSLGCGGENEGGQRLMREVRGFADERLLLRGDAHFDTVSARDLGHDGILPDCPDGVRTRNPSPTGCWYLSSRDAGQRVRVAGRRPLAANQLRAG